MGNVNGFGLAVARKSLVYKPDNGSSSLEDQYINRLAKVYWKYITYTFFIISDSPFGQLPFLDVDGKRLAQSNAISRFLAAQFGKYALGWKQLTLFIQDDNFNHRNTRKTQNS